MIDQKYQSKPMIQRQKCSKTAVEVEKKWQLLGKISILRISNHMLNHSSFCPVRSSRARATISWKLALVWCSSMKYLFITISLQFGAAHGKALLLLGHHRPPCPPKLQTHSLSLFTLYAFLRLQNSSRGMKCVKFGGWKSALWGGGKASIWGVEMCQIWGVEMCWDEVKYYRVK